MQPVLMQPVGQGGGDGGGGAGAEPAVQMDVEEVASVPSSAECGSIALQALGKVLDTQFTRTGGSVHRLARELSDVRSVISSTTTRLDGNLKQLQQLQLEHARNSLAESTKRENDGGRLEDQLRSMNERLQEAEEQCFFLKDTLYSILTSRSSTGMQVPPLTSKKPLKPLKGTPSSVERSTAPWNTAIMPSGM